MVILSMDGKQCKLIGGAITANHNIFRHILIQVRRSTPSEFHLQLRNGLKETRKIEPYSEQETQVIARAGEWTHEGDFVNDDFIRRVGAPANVCAKTDDENRVWDL